MNIGHELGGMHDVACQSSAIRGVETTAQIAARGDYTTRSSETRLSATARRTPYCRSNDTNVGWLF